MKRISRRQFHKFVEYLYFIKTHRLARIGSYPESPDSIDISMSVYLDCYNRAKSLEFENDRFDYDHPGFLKEPDISKSNWNKKISRGTDNYLCSQIRHSNEMPDYSHLWVVCEEEDCHRLNYKEHLKSRMNICEHCGYHLRMTSGERINSLLDEGTWTPMPKDVHAASKDSIEWDWDEDWDEDEFDAESPKVPDPEDPYDPEDPENPENPYDPDLEDPDLEEWKWYSEEEQEWDPEEESEEEPYVNRLYSYQQTTGLKEAVQTGTGQLNGIPVAIGIMEFLFMGGSMGSVVGEKITRLIEYATLHRYPLLLVCASGGARMQEGILSLMQMAKISSALYDYQINQKLFYVPILTSPTTGGVTASFGMLGDIILAEPNAYIAFAGKRVIEETLKTEVPEGSQSAEVLSERGFVEIVPRTLLKEVVAELFKLHGFVPNPFFLQEDFSIF